MILAFGDREPVVDPSAVVFEGATVVGSVHLGPRSSVWFGAVVRADVDDVWIGAGSVLLDGARIGKGAVIAAGAVVDGEVPPYEIWGGVPAVFLKKRP